MDRAHIRALAPQSILPRVGLAAIFVALFAVPLTGIAGCSSSSEATPPDAFSPDRDTGADTAADVAPDGTVSETGDADDAAPDASDAAPDATDGGDAAPDTAGCRTDAGCWACPPTVSEQFLNRCSGLSCQPFDNKRVTKWDGGALPPI
jgi:hypothetical protein